MTIYVRYDGFGWRARCPEVNHEMKSVHCSGPREAAENLCRALFPKDTWKLKFSAPKVYEVEMLP